MKDRIFWFLLILLSPVLPLYGYFRGNFYDVFEAYSFSMILGIVSYIYFLNSLILSARMRFFERIFGHDRLLALHKGLAGAALFTALFHWLIKGRLFTYVSGQMAFGFAAVGIFLVIILLTLGFMVTPRFLKGRGPAFLRIDYNRIKGIHNILVFAALLLGVHVLLASSTGERPGRMILMGVWALAAYALWVEHKVFRPLRLKKRAHAVEEVKALNDRTWEIRFNRGEFPPYRAGQFIYLRLKGDFYSSEEHPFTLSSAPEEPFLSVTVKDLGNYTNRLDQLQPGTPVTLEGPYGEFYAREERPLLLMGGGIGITPLFSLLKEGPGEAELFWSARRAEDLVYLEEIRALAAEDGQIRFHPYITEESSHWKGEIPEGEQGRMNVERIEAKLPRPLKDYSCFICGPGGMTDSLRKQLRKRGVKRRHIHWERFF
ncbi:MAG: ferredoxin reductase family protein [Spirochaetales bacterium]|nr:ferredoxin reductase family protein [Spirochaetales bacterium]